MQEEMVLEVGVLAEAARADVALERPRAAVHVHVRFQVPGRRERLGAECALVRFLLFVWFVSISKQHSDKINSKEKKKEKNNKTLVWFSFGPHQFTALIWRVGKGGELIEPLLSLGSFGL